MSCLRRKPIGGPIPAGGWRGRIGEAVLCLGLGVALSCAPAVGQDAASTRQDPAPVLPDTARAAGAVALPEAERPAFELPDVVVRGEDLTRIAGGERVASDAPELDAPPTETPRNLPAPQLSMSWRRARPFVLQPLPPPPRAAVPSWARIAMGSEPGLYGGLITGRPRDPAAASAWRLQVDGAWIDEPVSDTETQHVAVRLDHARGHWSRRPHWGFTVDGAVRRLDWDLERLPAQGSQTFAGVRGSVRGTWGESVASLRAELARQKPYRGGDEVRWIATEIGFEAGPPTGHVFLRSPVATLRVGGLFGDMPAGDPSDSGRGNSWGGRSWGEASLGFHAVRRATMTLWLGAQGQWDESRGAIGPKALLRWGSPESRWMLWSRVQTVLATDPWFDEAASRDYALLNLRRSATLEVPSLSFGGNALVSDWTLGATVSAKRLRSPRTWREDATSGLFVPVSAASRWVAEADVRLESSRGRPVRLELFAGFFDDGGGESLAFRPPVRAGSTLRARRGAYTAAVELEAWGRSRVTDSLRLPGAFLAHVEVGRSIGRAGRLWARWQNMTDDPAPLWPFVDSSKSSVHLGWDFRPASVWQGSREGTPG